MQRIALLNPLGDFGINQYCHELAEGLGMNGAEVSFYTGAANGLPPGLHHQRFPVLNSALFKQREAFLGRPQDPPVQAYRPDWPQDATRITSNRSTVHPPANCSWPRKAFLTLELALHLKARGCSVVWTHWPEMESYHPAFWRLCRRLGMFVMHTVHNVAPHDAAAAESWASQAAYESAHLLVVHSEFARAELLEAYPQFSEKIVICRHGAYTIYERRPQIREHIRRSLGISPDQTLILLCGAIRPYKNIDGVLRALCDPRCRRSALVVAGTEAGFPDCVPGDPLGRTRRLALELGIDDRVRLIPRHLSIFEMSDLFEAGDIKALPYLKGYGSGLLLLAMTFGKYIVSTRTGGAEEYLANYRRATLLPGSGSQEVADGIAEALRRIDEPSPPPESLSHLQWTTIARQALQCISEAQSHPGPLVKGFYRDGLKVKAP